MEQDTQVTMEFARVAGKAVVADEVGSGLPRTRGGVS